MPDRPVRAVVFDLGGVLARICHTWDEVLQVSGFPPVEPPLGQFVGFRLFDPYQAAACTLEEYCAELGVYLGGLSPEQALHAHNHILREPYAGTLELVQRLRASGLRTACLSNTNAPHWDEFLHTDRFPAVLALDAHIASHVVGVNKPDPAIYHAVEAALGIAGDEVLYFDDHPANVEGARRVGWRAEVIDPEAETVPQIAAWLQAHGVALPA